MIIKCVRCGETIDTFKDWVLFHDSDGIHLNCLEVSDSDLKAARESVSPNSKNAFRYSNVSERNLGMFDLFEWFKKRQHLKKS